MERNYVTVILCIHNDCVHLCVQHDAHDSARPAGPSEAADTRLTLIFPRANINISRITMRRRCAACFGCWGARHKRINEKAKCAVRASLAAATLSVLLLPACWMSFDLRSSWISALPVVAYDARTSNRNASRSDSQGRWKFYTIRYEMIF